MALEVIDEIRVHLSNALQEKLVGLYLYGSYVAGGFEPDLSDLDFLAVLDEPPSVEDLATLRDTHEAIEQTHPHWRGRIEVIYAGKETLRSFRTRVTKIAKISPGEPLHGIEAGRDWLINWYLVQSTGQALLGPSPDELITPITHEEYLEAVRGEAEAWRDRISTMHTRPGQSYAILTMCRAYFAVEHGRQASKREAARWAAVKLPHRSSLIDKAIEWRQNVAALDYEDLSELPEVQSFIDEVSYLVKGR